MEGLPPICVDCAHFDENSAHPITCRAFPQGIPDEIFTFGNPHLDPFPGDNDLRFEPRDGQLTNYAARLIEEYRQEQKFPLDDQPD
jgi:hypothetical protein